jgi:hypothetical protein
MQCKQNGVSSECCGLMVRLRIAALVPPCRWRVSHGKYRATLYHDTGRSYCCVRHCLYLRCPWCRPALTYCMRYSTYSLLLTAIALAVCLMGVVHCLLTAPHRTNMDERKHGSSSMIMQCSAGLIKIMEGSVPTSRNYHR